MRAVNLLPRAIPRERPRASLAVQLAVVAPLVVVALLVAGRFLASSATTDRQATLDALSAELAALPAVDGGRVDASLEAQHAQRVAAVASALSVRVAWDRILRNISSILPEDVWLTRLDARSPVDSAATGATGTAPTPSTTSGSPLTIAGYTYSQEGVARFMSRLQVIADLADVRLQKSETATVAGRLVVQFTILASIRRVAS